MPYEPSDMQKQHMKSCYEHGLEMYAAATVLFQNPKQKVGEIVVYTIHAECMMMAFACELFIKTMLYYEGCGKEIRGHSLKSLFEDLSTETQKSVIDFMINQCKYKSEDIYRDLDTVKDYFVKTRYEYEEPPKDGHQIRLLHTGFLFSFGYTLMRRCIAGESAWENI